MRLAMIAVAVWSCSVSLYLISKRLEQIAVQMTIANCLTEAKAGVTCPAAKP